MLEPNIVIPMHYQIDGLDLPLEGVERFSQRDGHCRSPNRNQLKNYDEQPARRNAGDFALTA